MFCQLRLPIIRDLTCLKFFSRHSLQVRPGAFGGTKGGPTRKWVETQIVRLFYGIVNLNRSGAPPHSVVPPLALRRFRQWASRAKSSHLSARLIFLLLTWFPLCRASAEELSALVPTAPIQVRAESAVRWQEGTRQVLLLDRPFELQQGTKRVQGERGVIWLQSAPAFGLRPHKIQLYVENGSVLDLDAGSANATQAVPQWVGTFSSPQPIDLPFPIADQQPDKMPALYQRALIALEPAPPSKVSLAQFVAPQTGGGQMPPFLPGPTVGAPAQPVNRSIKISKRGDVRIQFQWFPSLDGQEQIAIINSGVNILISGDPVLGPLDISTDRLVIWTPNTGESPLVDGGENSSRQYELYLEGNIVFRQGERVIYANSMYYNVQQESGVVLDAELLSPVPEYQGLVRLKAAVLRQIGSGKFQANGAAVTSSRLGVPRYWFQAGELNYEEVDQPFIDPFTGAPLFDPITGGPVSSKQRLAVSRNNRVFVGGLPVFYWPTLATDLTRPSTLINRVRVNRDRVFGTQIGTGLDLGRLSGLSGRVPGVEWNGTLDYLSRRGWGVGTDVTYDLDRFFQIEGPTRGYFDAWGIDEDGLDNLGADRRALVPEEDVRGRLLWQHRQRTPGGYQITAEAGFISDRNFLEQYYESEWDQWKDQATGVEIKRLVDNGSWSIAADVRLNDFFTQTQWYPRIDQFQLGQSLWSDRLTWYGHSQVGYADLKVADRPLDPVDAAKFNPLPWEVERDGIRAGARHELDVPFQLGAAKVVPYVLGDVMHWGEDINGDDLTRLYGQAGVRASLPMWKVDPSIQSELFNVNGLSHKIVFEAEFLWADADQNFDQLPLYDQLDDDSQEHFRRRFIDDVFGGAPFVDDALPLRFDERHFAFRSGMQSWVTAHSAEVADDLMLLRMGARQRWQTKRGLPGQQRIVDWMTLDVEGSLFPKDDRDNFGEVIGMLNYDWRWHLGDRLTLMSDGFADTFGDGLKMFTVGGYISRPERGSLFAGFRSISGPIDSNVLNVALNYRMSEKWIGTVAGVYDFGETGNIGQLFELTRIGESFLVTVSARVDESRDNVGFGFAIEPRFFPLSYRGFVGGSPIAPAGARGLE